MLRGGGTGGVSSAWLAWLRAGDVPVDAKVESVEGMIILGDDCKGVFVRTTDFGFRCGSVHRFHRITLKLQYIYPVVI